jgi:hypothetical protein
MGQRRPESAVKFERQHSCYIPMTYLEASWPPSEKYGVLNEKMDYYEPNSSMCLGSGSPIGGPEQSSGACCP